MHSHVYRFVRFSLLILSVNLATSAQYFLIGVDGGASKTSGSGIDDLKLGFSIAADGVWRPGDQTIKGVGDYVQIGLRYSFSDWTPALDALSESLRENVKNITAISGSTWSMEIAPLLRATTIFKNNVVNLFAQVGAGVYIINAETTINAIDTMNQPVTYNFGTGTDSHFGVSFGGGVTIGEAAPVMFRLYPIFHYVVRDENPDHYWTINAGVVFGLGN